MEVTKWLKPSISVSRIGDSASVQAATRVNVEQVDALSEDYAHRSNTDATFIHAQFCKPRSLIVEPAGSGWEIHDTALAP
jgi:hypothetical protein